MDMTLPGRKRPSRSRKHAERRDTGRGPLIAGALFLAVLLLTGGSSRFDMPSLIVLYPAAALACTYALTRLTGADFARVRVPLLLLLALGGWMALQLVPLPPSLWHGLPQRDAIVAIDALTGNADLWRPLTLVPNRTLSTLAGLLVPLAAILLYTVQPRDRRRMAVHLLGLIGLASALWGALQMLGAPDGPMYLYRITNEGLAVGFFANRNHQGVVLACSIVALAWVAIHGSEGARGGTWRILALSGIALIAPIIVLAGSRAGLFLCGAALALSAWMWWQRPLPGGGKGKARSVNWWVVAGLALVPLALIAIVLTSSRSLALTRLFEEDETEGLRLQLIPIVNDLIATFFPWGSGFGTFQQVYGMVEPFDMLEPRYLNLAHNDVWQWPLEGGLPAVLILLVFLGWLGLRAVRAIGEARDRFGSVFASQRVVALVILAFMLAAAFFDYALRTPIGMVYFAIGVCVLTQSGGKRVGRTD